MNTEGIAMLLDWPALADGFAVLLLLLTLLDRLRRLFAARGETQGLGGRLDALQGLYLTTRAAADEARERSTDLEREQRDQRERLAEQVVRPLERIAAALERGAGSQAAQAAALESVLRRLDRLDPGAQAETDGSFG